MKTLIFLTAFLLSSQTAISQSPADNLEGRFGITLDLSLFNQGSIWREYFPLLNRNFLGTFTLQHWVSNQISYEFSTGIIDRYETGGVEYNWNRSNSKISLIPFFVGVKYYTKPESNTRVYLNIAMGPVIEARTYQFFYDFDFGFKSSLGIDHFISKQLHTGLNLGLYFLDNGNNRTDKIGFNTSLSTGIIF